MGRNRDAASLVTPRVLGHHVAVRPDQHEYDAADRRSERPRRKKRANEQKAAADEPDQAAKGSDRNQHEDTIERARALRRQLAVIAGQLAGTERNVADIQE